MKVFYKSRLTLIFIVLFQFNSELIFSQNKVDSLKLSKTHSLSVETKEYLKSLKLQGDSLDLESLPVLLNIGYADVHMGNNRRGNELMSFVLNSVSNPNYELYHELSVQNTKNGNYQIAVNYLDQAVQLSPEVYGYYGWVMLYYYRDYKRALEYLEKHDSLTPNFSDNPSGENIHFLYGLAHMRLNHIDKAIEEFEKCISEVSDRNGEDWVEVSTFYYNGICHQLQKDYKEALKNYAKAIKYNKTFVEAYYQRGLCFLELNKPKKAKIDFIKSKENINLGFSKTDSYMEIFNPVYIQDIDKVLLLNYP